jgi:hypothetical protein
MTTATLSRPVQFAAWAILGAATAVTAWGVGSNGLFAQEIWQPTGLARLGFLALGYAIWTAVFLFTRPAWFAPVTLALAVAFTAAAVGPLPVAAALLFLLSSFVTGALMLGSAEILSLLVGIAIWMAAIGAAAHFPVNYPWVYLPALLAPLAVRPSRTRECLRVCARWVAPVRFECRWTYVALAAAGFPLLCHLLVALKPEMGTDALAVHLMLPAWVSFQHVWPFDFRHLSWALTPLGADWCYTAVYLLGGEFAARLLNFALLAVVSGLVYTGARRHVAPPLALLAAGLFASTPLVQLVTGSLFVENLWAALLVGIVLALDRFHSTVEPRWLYAAAVLTGASLATKFGSLAFAIPASAVAAWMLFAHRKKLPARRIAAGAAVLVLLFGAPPYVYAYAKTGNPVFPFLNHVFRSQWFDAKKNLADTRYQARLALSTPYDLVFHTRQYLEAHDGALGFQYLLLAPLALLLCFSRRSPFAAKLALAMAAVFSLLTYSGVSYVRYLYPALPLVAIAGAFALERLRTNRALFRATLGALAAAFALNLYFLPSSSWYHPDFFLNPFDRTELLRHYTEVAPVRKLIEHMNNQHPGAPVAFFDTGHIAELRAPAYVMDWQNAGYSGRAWVITRPAAYGRFATGLGIRYFIAPAHLNDRELYVIRAFLSRYTDLESAFGTFEVRHLKPDAAAQWSRENEERVAGACDSGMLDDTSPRLHYSGSWKHLTHFGSACGETLAFSNAAGAEVSIDFIGTGISYLYTKAFTRGIAEVFIDGESRGLLDEFSLGIEWRSRAVYGGLAPGRHTFTVRVLHRSAEDSLGEDIDVDGFVVTP